jgi:hypothetical protein
MHHTSAINIAMPATPPTTPPAIAPVLVDDTGFASLVFVGVEDAVTKLDDTELGVGTAVAHKL